MKRGFLLILLLTLPLLGMAQKKKKKDKKSLKDRVTEMINRPKLATDSLLYQEADTDTLPDVDLKVKKNHFFGVKTKRNYTKSERQGRLVIEDFYVLPEPVEVNPYVPVLAILDRQRGQVRSASRRNGKLENVLHGPYKKLINDKVVEEGMYFYGMKHQRWVYLTRQDYLYGKEHYHKGWFRDSEIEYYDGDKKERVKTVIPIQYGKKEGYFYHFFENGRLAVRGKYEFDKKVGIWEEFYPGNRTTVKREIQFASDPFQKDFKPYIRKEWDQFGNPTYVSPKITQGG